MSCVGVSVIIPTLEVRKLSLREKLALGLTARPGAAPHPSLSPTLPPLSHRCLGWLSPLLDCEPRKVGLRLSWSPMCVPFATQ